LALIWPYERDDRINNGSH